VRPITVAERVAGRVPLVGLLSSMMGNNASGDGRISGPNKGVNRAGNNRTGQAKVPSVFHQRSQYLVLDIFRSLSMALLKIVLAHPSLVNEQTFQVFPADRPEEEARNARMLNNANRTAHGAGMASSTDANQFSQRKRQRDDGTATNDNRTQRRRKYSLVIHWSVIFEHILEGARRQFDFIQSLASSKGNLLVLAKKNDSLHTDLNKEVAATSGNSGGPGAKKRHLKPGHGMDETDFTVAHGGSIFDNPEFSGIKDYVVPLALYLVESPFEKGDGKSKLRWSLSVGISRSSGIFFKPQKSYHFKRVQRR
jgi:hypothetical protein